MAKSRERSKGITLFVSSAGKLTLPPTINYTTRIKEMVGVVEYVLWPSLIVMVPTLFRHLRRFSESTLPSLMSGGHWVNWRKQQFTKVSGSVPIVLFCLVFGCIVRKVNEGTCHRLTFAIAISCQTSDFYIARSCQYSIARSMYLLLLFSQSLGSEVYAM